MKIMIVDDSIVFRTAISQALEEVSEVEVFKTASNGKIAVDFLQSYPQIDIVILDMEMPVMDGMETIKEIRKFNHDVSIIVFSGTTLQAAEKTIDALHFGADDFVPKIIGEGTIDASVKMIQAELLPRITALMEKKEKVNKPLDVELEEAKKTGVLNINSLVNDMQRKPKLIVLGSSTGGPEALNTIFSKLNHELTVPILIAQHMPPVFTAKLAEMLNKLSPNTVQEAKQGERIKEGHVYIAPGDYHMEISRELTISLNKKEKVCFVRPSVDVLFESVSINYNDQIMSIILTGMGEDGANGCEKLKDNNAYQFIQDEKSCIVWGMPGAVHERNIGAQEIDLYQIADLINAVSKRL
jgi:two-component system chemotaxis response regulator CheB